ncbi:PREDICTED: uncharacterized protein LOC109473275 [Branchiostoma belcheri]|uniref:Uncharacterized protein LOC109473275 n=1 Tax=Branchiostoma belcheri TaxID=7741 RepID=A0A6P4YWJ9_BRABE|nr:PREDICTED: uncharacterized protein LOC109473275 [Branchiostoma belcheri]
MAGYHIWFVLIWMCLGLVGVSSKLLLVKTPVNPEVNQTVSLNCSGVFGSTMVKRLCPGQALPYYTKVEDGYGRMYYFPPSADTDRAGIYRCENFEGERVSIDTSIFPPNGTPIFSPFFSMTAHVGDDVTLTMAVREDSALPTANLSWRLYQPGPNCAGALLPENQDVIIRQNVTSRKDGGMYEMSVSDVRQGTQRTVVQLLVTDCPERLWGPDCSQPCLSCENGGVCGEDGRCVCPPGFTGDVCQIGCGPNTYGYDCESTCGGNCTDMLFCLLPPYGCSCGAGLRGTDCHQECAGGTYGAGCSQTCGHCQDGVTCDPHTGTCPQERCEPGWQGNTCKKQITHEGDSSSAYLIVLGVAACTLVLVGSPLWFYLRTTSKCAPKISGPDFDLSTVRGISDLAQTRSPYIVESFIKDDLHIRAKSKFLEWEISRAILNIDTKAIGSGAFGKVYKATVTENTGSTRLPGVVAIKRLKGDISSAYLIVLGVAACTLVLIGSPLWFYLRTTSKCAPKISGPDFDLSTVRGISDLAQTRSPYTVESFIKDDLHITAKSKFSDWEISRAILNIDTKAIGSGAFGKVYKARVTENTGSTRLPGVVAIKRLKGQFSSLPGC